MPDETREITGHKVTLVSFTLSTMSPLPNPSSWSELPGSFDSLNMRHLFPSSNVYGIPDLNIVTDRGRPARLVGYNERHLTRNPQAGDCVHFFLDDYRFETMWTRPRQSLSRVQGVGWALTPDFSMWTDAPLATQIWQTYRARWCGAWMLAHGIDVIPTITWANEDSYPFAFLGIPPGVTVAVSTVGVTSPHEQALYQAGMREMMRQVGAARVLVYGQRRIPIDGMDGVDLIYYPTRWQAIRGDSDGR